MPRTNKRISHGSMLARDMRLIRGEGVSKPTPTAKTAPVGPSEGMIEKLLERRKKFSFRGKEKSTAPNNVTGPRG